MSTLDNIEHHLPFVPPDIVQSVHPDIPIAVLKKNLKEFLHENHKRSPKKKHFEENSEHFKELVLAVDDLHHTLQQRHNPYRFCVYLENGEVMIDVLLLDEKGKSVKIMKKDITHEDFITWFEDLESGTGIFFDSTA